MGAHSRQRRTHRQVQCSKRRAATLERVRDKAGDDLRPRYRRALWRDAVEIQDQHSSKLTLSQSDQMDPDHFEVVPARPEDIDLVLGILDEAASWIIERKLPAGCSLANSRAKRSPIRSLAERCTLGWLTESPLERLLFSGMILYSGESKSQTLAMFTSSQ